MEEKEKKQDGNRRKFREGIHKTLTIQVLKRKLNAGPAQVSTKVLVSTVLDPDMIHAWTKMRLSPGHG